MDYEKEYKRKALEPIVNYIESVMASYSKEELEARIKKALPEAEDERIKRGLLRCLDDINDGWIALHGISKNDAIAYLEKQKINTEGDFARGYDCGYECCLHSQGAEWFEKQKESLHIPETCKENANSLIITKVCNCCGRELPITMFYKNSFTNDGLQYMCKDCAKEHSRNGRIKEQSKRYMDYLGKNAQTVLSELSDDCVIEEIRRRGYKGELTKSIVVNV